MQNFWLMLRECYSAEWSQQRTLLRSMLGLLVVAALPVVLLAGVVEDAAWTVVGEPSLVDVGFSVVVAAECVVET